MSSNNHALIRYRTIDRCLKSSNKDYFVEDLIKECSDSVYEYEQSRKGSERPYKLISKRSLMYDLKFMKDEVFGFGAPIEYDKEEGYYYSDPQFEAFKAKISKSDTERLGEALLILKQLSGERNFKEIESMVTRLEETYQIKTSRKRQAVIQFENSTNIEGQKWVGELKERISSKESLRISYQPFGSETKRRSISPYLIKEYNNRWFLIGFDHEIKKITNLGLDRIKKVESSIIDYHLDNEFDASSYAKDIVGVSIQSDSKKLKIKIKAHGRQKFYLDTKPIHHSQKKIKDHKDYAIFQLEVKPNFELQSKILSNIDTLEVMSPKAFKEAVKNRLQKAIELYSI